MKKSTEQFSAIKITITCILLISKSKQQQFGGTEGKNVNWLGKNACTLIGGQQWWIHTNTHSARAGFNWMECDYLLNVAIVHWFHLNKRTAKISRRSRAKNASQFCIILLVRFAQFQYNTIDWFDKSERSPDTHTPTQTHNRLCWKLWKTGSSQLHHEFTNFKTISKPLIEFWYYHKFLSWKFVVGRLFCIKFLLFIEWVCVCVCVWLAVHMNQWSMEWINGFATRKTRPKSRVFSVYFVAVLHLRDWCREHSHFMIIVNVLISSRKPNRHQSAD